jgi:hypothetical protein
MARLEARNYMEEYSQENNQIPALLELAKLDSEMIQSLHHTELDEICRWFYAKDYAEKTQFLDDWAAIIPNLVGKPKTKPSPSDSSFGVMSGTSLLGGAVILPSTSSWSVFCTCLQVKYS